MQRRSLVAVLALALSLAAARADAVTVRDVIELSKAGLSDSVLTALIDVDRSVFSIDTATLKQLKSAGVSDAVIVAMIRSGREAGPDQQALQMPPVAQEPAPASAAEPQEPAQLALQAAPPVAYPVAIPVPVYIAGPVAPSHGDGRRVAKHAAAQPDRVPSCQSAQLPVWGFGGNVRQLPPVCR